MYSLVDVFLRLSFAAAIVWLARTNLSLYHWDAEKATKRMWLGIAVVAAVELVRIVAAMYQMKFAGLGGWAIQLLQIVCVYVAAVGFYRRRLA